MEIESAKGDTHTMNQPAKLSDEEWKVMYENNFEVVKQYVLTNSGNEQQAEDLYQDAFIAAWRNVQLGRFESRGERSFANYVLAIAKNKWIDVLRSLRSRKTIQMTGDVEHTETDPWELSEEDKAIELVKQHFAHMGQQCRDLLTAFYYRKQSMKEISFEKGWTEQTSRNNKYRCIQKLRELINQKIP